MHCPNCGTKLEHGQKFCMNCGARVQGDTEEHTYCATVQHSSNHKRAGRYSSKKKKKFPVLKIIFCFLLLILLFALLLVLLGKEDQYFESPIVSCTQTNAVNETEYIETLQTNETVSIPEDPYYAKAYIVALAEYGKYIEAEEAHQFMQAAYGNNITLDMLNRQPEYYIGKEVYFGGEVIQAMYDPDNLSNVELRIQVYTAQSEQDIIYVTYTLKDGETRILEEDYVDVYGFSEGLVTYEAVLGNSITIPLINGQHLYCHAVTDGSVETPAMKTMRQRISGTFISDSGESFSFASLGHADDNVLSDATEYGDCIVAYYTPIEGWDENNPPPFYRITAFDDGTMIIFEPRKDAPEGIYATDDGTYTKYTPTDVQPDISFTETSVPAHTEEPADEEPVYEALEELDLVGYVLASSGGLKIRSGPSTSYEEVGRLAPLDTVTILEINSEGSRDWGRIDHGWICMDYIVFDEPNPMEPPFDFITDMYVGHWSDQVGQRASMDVSYQNGLFTFNISWGNSAFSTSKWTLCGSYDDNSGGIIYHNGKYSIWETAEDGSQIEYVQYTDGEGLFYIAGNSLYWDDYRNNAGVNCEFVKRY